MMFIMLLKQRVAISTNNGKEWQRLLPRRAVAITTLLRFAQARLRTAPVRLSVGSRRVLVVLALYWRY